MWFGLSAISGFLAVALGAFGAHGLKGKISENLFSAFQTAVHYQMFHTLALFALAIFMFHLEEIPQTVLAAAYLWLCGVLLFSGSLYGLALGGPSWLGPITPIGGLLLMAGWLLLGIAAMTSLRGHVV